MGMGAAREMGRRSDLKATLYQGLRVAPPACWMRLGVAVNSWSHSLGRESAAAAAYTMQVHACAMRCCMHCMHALLHACMHARSLASHVPPRRIDSQLGDREKFETYDKKGVSKPQRSKEGRSGEPLSPAALVVVVAVAALVVATLIYIIINVVG